MNERIRELKEQALIWAVEKLDPNALNDNEWGVAIDKKFAELIVGECCDWIDGSPSTDAGQLLLTKSFIIANLKGHFGVES